MDLKPENIMIKAVRLASEDTTETSSSGGRDRDAKNPDDSVRGVQLSVKLIDFGLAKVLKDKDPSKRSAVAGTFDYLAPEARLGFPETASDLWSTGIVLHALLVGMLPPTEVREGTRPLDMTGPQYRELKESAKDLVATLLRIDAKDRATASQAQQCAWLTEQMRSETLDVALQHEGDRRERMNKTMVGFLSFHQSTLLRKAVLTAMAMQAAGSSVEELKEQFMRADVDGNGVISKQELLNAINISEQGTSMGPDIGLKNDVHKWFEKIFDSVDTDGSDGIDYTEWIAGAMEHAKLQREEAMKTAFHAFDLDGSGTISQAEFARVLANTPEDIARCMPEFDANGDGLLSYDEFKAMIINCPLPTEPPGRASTGHDGKAAHAPAQDVGRPGYLRALSACSAASTYVDTTRVHEWWRLARSVFRPAKRNSR
jgi:Ca2+-binding EF-hand superfamily protein